MAPCSAMTGPADQEGTTEERRRWLQDRRRRSEAFLDSQAPTYDENWGEIAPSHRDCLSRFLELCPSKAAVLDAACGTGKYWALVLEAGHRLVGIDHSRGMLHQAKAKFPTVPVEKLVLLQLSFEREFDAVMCVDAMELVPPEDWPLVLSNFHRALRPSGHLYFTVELPEDSGGAAEAAGDEPRVWPRSADDLHAGYERARAMGLPVVLGEWTHGGGYHYYPAIDQVRRWLSDAQFTVVHEAVGDDYLHFIAVRSS